MHDCCLQKQDDYDSRIYTYENDVLYQIWYLRFYGQVTRAYLNVEYNYSKSIWVLGPG